MGKARTRWRIAWLIGLVPAAVLLYAAVMKGLDPSLFSDQITAHRITPPSWSPVLARFFIAAEFLVGAALVLRTWPRLTHGIVIAMMIGFIAATGWAWSHGNARECGCFGRAVSRGPRGVILEDAALVLISGAAILLWRGFRTRRGSKLGVAALLAPIAAFTALGYRVPADSFVTGVGPGSDISDLAIEDLRSSPVEGTALMVLVDGSCRPCDLGVPGLSDLARRRRDVRVFAVFAGTGQEAMEWRLRLLPAFPVAHASARALRAYYRALPASFLLREGRVVRAYWGRIPSEAELALHAPHR